MKILMVLMGLDTGGAETHVVELSRALCGRGYEVCIASAGGVYEKTLAEAGIRHVTLPLKRKDPISTVVSFFGLRRLIKQGFDVVHCHARIPAFVTSLIYRNARFCRKYPFRFVTTAHWVFRVGPLLRLGTVWGERCIAVSNDIAHYLTDEYRYPPERISVTVNGVDTVRFAPVEAVPDGDTPVVCCVSRLDRSRSRCAEELIGAVAALDAEGIKVRAVIVGGGDVEAVLRAVAGKLNNKLGRQAVTLTGAVTDVERYIAGCSVFCGVSRAALEAMSCGKQVILAGNEGYLGIFGENVRKKAETSNFCCREGECTAELLAEDIKRALSLPVYSPENRRYIVENYSAGRMADDCARVYDSVVRKGAGGAVVAGYYGYGNAGDEAILRAITENVGGRLTVLSAKPLATRYSCACDAINRFDPFAVSRAMKRAGLLIFGGGSLLQNKTSTKSLMYYLSLISHAEKLGCKVMIYSNGIGPVYGNGNIDKVKKALESADVITLRDGATVEKAERMGIDKDRLVLSCDPAVLLGRAPAVLEMHAVDCFAPEGDYVAVALRRLKHRAAADVLCEACRAVYERTGRGIAVLAMDRRRDSSVCKALAARLSRFVPKEKLRLVSGVSYSEAEAVIAYSDAVYSMRLHALVFAARRGIPCVGVSHDEKISDYINSAGAEGVRCSAVPPYATGGEIADAIVSAISAGRYTPSLENLKALAENDAKTASRLAAEAIAREEKRQ
ncbi:MAG: polysaccharide pyruvyl transferase CsaB [Clostridia bacterium]|nr:polysaccharide pyruvyl transferase CsaB [Clostridia bacterium]